MTLLGNDGSFCLQIIPPTYMHIFKFAFELIDLWAYEQDFAVPFQLHPKYTALKKRKKNQILAKYQKSELY